VQACGVHWVEDEVAREETFRVHLCAKARAYARTHARLHTRTHARMHVRTRDDLVAKVVGVGEGLGEQLLERLGLHHVDAHAGNVGLLLGPTRVRNGGWGGRVGRARSSAPQCTCMPSMH